MSAGACQIALWMLLFSVGCAHPRGATWEPAVPKPLPSDVSGPDKRRALIIGINQYAVNSRTDRAGDLRGAVNDAQVIRAVLNARYGFRNIHLLINEQATRQRILQEIQDYLIAAAKPGDLSLLYFAGHGSWAENLDSPERDRKDETLVPADANRGTPDIHDKELALLFNQVLDRQARLVAIFDSCHSGTIARRVGFPGETRVRFARPARVLPPHLPKALPPGQRPEERGALIFSATQDQDPAQEVFFEGEERGLFTSAFQQVLRAASVKEPAEQLFLRTRALMQSSGSRQEPVLAGTAERRARPLLADEPGAPEERPVVALTKIEADSGQVVLQGGLAIGLGRLAELSRLGETNPLRLRVKEVLGMSTSVATVLPGSAAPARPGDLFVVENPGQPVLDRLSVFWPQDAPAALEIQQTVAELAPLTQAPLGVTDPTEPGGPVLTHVLRWDRGGYELVQVPEPTQSIAPYDSRSVSRSLGPRPTLAQVQALLQGSAAPHLFVALPPPREVVQALRLGAGTANSAVDARPHPADADYLLTGRIHGTRLELTWIHPGAIHGDRELLPPRAAWTPAEHASLPALLENQVLRINKVKAWLHLHSPAGTDRFPYKLALRDQQTGAHHDEAELLHRGAKYDLLLMRKEGVPLTGLQPRYVYVFSIDQQGRGELLYPTAAAGNVENRIPDARDSGLPAEKLTLGPGFEVSEAGTDMLILLTSGSAIPNPASVFTFDGVRASRPLLDDPLAMLLMELGENPRAVRMRSPTDWSIERLPLHSVVAP